MGNNEDFYIGWLDRMPKSNRKAIRNLLICLFLLTPFFTLTMVVFQKPFNNYHFELGHQREFRGIYQAKPVPMLEVSSPFGNKNLLLVGYGKFGAGGIISSAEQKFGQLDGKTITFKGTLISGDKELLELTDKVNSIIAVSDSLSLSSAMVSSEKEVTLVGEILDPKCYFGVMKPGEGKIHRSCAIRCISGGIPPVLRVLSNSDSAYYSYYIVLGKDGQAINKSILPFVGESVRLRGTVTQHLDWFVLYRRQIESVANSK